MRSIRAILRRVAMTLAILAATYLLLHDGSPDGDQSRQQTVEALPAILGGFAAGATGSCGSRRDPVRRHSRDVIISRA